MQMEKIKLFDQNSNSTSNSVQTFSAQIVSDKAWTHHLYSQGVGHSNETVSYTHLTLPTIHVLCRSRWSPYH